MKACLLENCLAVNLAVPAKYACLFSSSHNSAALFGHRQKILRLKWAKKQLSLYYIKPSI
jgi:hypothetical protein